MDRMLGITYGLAYGDALGRPTEFITSKALAKFGTPFRPAVGLTNRARGFVTDDTQMSLAVGRAALGTAEPRYLTNRFIAEFIRWYDDPKSRDGRRAPGSTCLSACAQLKRGTPWLRATRTDSKGNGANMRVAPLALRTDWTWPQLSAAAQLQAAITHGHATALAAADLTAVAVRMLLEGVAKPGPALLDHLLAYAHDQRSVYHGDHLGKLWEGSSFNTGPSWLSQLPASYSTGRLWEDDASWPIGAVVRKPLKARRHRPAPDSPEEFIERGWDKVIDSLLAIYDRPRKPNQDPCDVAGEGWVAEEALMVALHTLLTFPDDPTSALRRAAFTNGDSDSIASITGALAGAAYGRRYFPHGWIENLEYRREIDSLTARLANAASC
jgi:ADP-ribosylglycohydrolase